MIKHLGGAFASLRLYPISHPSVTKNLDDLYDSIKDIIGNKNRMVIAITRNIPIVDGIPVYQKNIHLDSFRELFNRKNIEVIIIKTQITKEELIPFLNILKEEDNPDKPIHVGRVLEKQNIKNILIKDLNFDEEAKETYLTTIDTISRTLEDVRLGNKISILENKRAVRNIVNTILIDQNTLLSLTMIKNYNDYLYSHSVNVCILASTLAEELGYSEEEINEIGLAGLLHDIGKLKTPKSILLKPGKLNEDEWKLMKKHPTLGSQLLSEHQGVSHRTIKMVYEHHMRPNPDGYPALKSGEQISPESQIIAVADTFDASTTLRPYQDPLTQIEAIKKMKRMSIENKHFNTKILDTFVKMLGIYPIGATVRLDTNELALVTRYNLKQAAPVVKIFIDKDGHLLEDMLEVDLNDRDSGTGKPTRSVVNEIDALSRNLDLTQVFLK